VLCSVQIKSLDKKLRKLDAAMTHAKDDPSLLHAVNGYARWSESSEHAGWNGAELPMLCSTDASNATTPTSSSPRRHAASLVSPSCSGSRTPWDVPFPSAAVYKKMAEGQKDMSFDAKGLNSPREPPALDFQIMSPEAELGEVKMEGEEDGGWGGETSDTQVGMSDQDIIAMLADCAARPEPSPHHKFAQVLNERITAVADEMRHSEDAESAAHVQEAHACDRHPALEDGDDALMAALANCCGDQSHFEAEDDEKGVRQQDALEQGSLDACAACSLSEDIETRFEDEVMALQTFSGCHGLTLEDLA
jgi:hypothetical protein